MSFVTRAQDHRFRLCARLHPHRAACTTLAVGTVTWDLDTCGCGPPTAQVKPLFVLKLWPVSPQIVCHLTMTSQGFLQVPSGPPGVLVKRQTLESCLFLVFRCQEPGFCTSSTFPRWFWCKSSAVTWCVFLLICPPRPARPLLTAPTALLLLLPLLQAQPWRGGEREPWPCPGRGPPNFRIFFFF